jgi:hypothetical protein
MTITVFQALCLLPDSEQFVLLRKVAGKQPGYARLKRQRARLTVEQAVELVERGGSSQLKRSPGQGYVITAGRFFLKADGKKAKKLADSLGLHFKRKAM